MRLALKGKDKSLLVAVFIPLFLFFFFHGLPQLAFAQTLLLDEQFNDNRNRWPVDNNPHAWVSIQGGKLFLAGRTPNGGYTIINHVPGLNGVRDYTIEASLSKISGVENSSYGIIWGGADLGNFYLFAITGEDQYSAARMQGGVFVDSTPLMAAPLNKGQNAVNILKIVYRKDRAYHFINGTLYGFSSHAAKPSDGVGFMVNNTDYIAADYLRVSAGLLERDEGLCAELDAGQSDMAAPQRFRLGAGLKDMDASLVKSLGFNETYGVYVDDVEPNSPAQSNGVMKGDIILSVNGVKAYTAPGTANMITLLPKAELQIWRQGKGVTVGVVLSAVANAPSPADIMLSYPIVVSKVEALPDKVKPNGKFDLKVTYLARGEKGAATAPVELMYTISKAGKILLEKSSSFDAPAGTEQTLVKSGMTAGQESGSYEIRVTLRTQGKSASATAGLIVE